MGRRALRRVDPALDLSQHLMHVEDLPQPLLLQALCRVPGPLELEVGSGKGLFLATASGQCPTRNFIGCEIARKYARFAAARLARLQRPNALVVLGDASVLFQRLPPASVAAVHVYFPDPWWKKRHRRRRILQPPFLHQVERVLADHGLLHFWTDVHEYHQTALADIAAATKLQGPFHVPEQPAESDMDFRTHFERRVRLHGADVWRVQFRKP